MNLLTAAAPVALLPAVCPTSPRRQRRKAASIQDRWPHTMTETQWAEAYNKLNKRALADIYFGR